MSEQKTNMENEQEKILEQINCGVARLAFSELKVEVLYANARFSSLCNTENNTKDIFFGEENYYKLIYNPIYENGEIPNTIRFEYDGLTNDGKKIFIGADGRFLEKQNNKYIYAFTFTDITELRECILEQKRDDGDAEPQDRDENAATDKLTGLWSRTAFPNLVNDYITGGGNRDDALLLISIEHFMSINDRYGYMFGDAVLGEIADCLRKTFRGDHIIGRLAGVEFAVLVRNVSKDELRQMTEQLCKAIRGIYVGENNQVTLDTRVVICFIRDDDSFSRLSERSHQMLYRMKNTENLNYVFEDEEDAEGDLEEFEHGADYVNVASDEIFEEDRTNEDIVSFAFHVFEQTTDAKSAINVLLRRIGKTYGLHRVSVVELQPEKRLSSYVYQWSRSVNLLTKGQEITYTQEQLDKLLDGYSADGMLECPGTQYVPFTHREGDTCFAQNVLFCALYEEGRYTGHLLLESFAQEHVWDEETKNVLKEVGRILASYLVKVRADEANKSKGEFISRMSHEIRTPMNAICGMTDLLLQNGLTGLNYEYAQTIKMASNNLISIVNDILDISKMEAGKLEIIPEEYELRGMIEELIVLVNRRIAEKDIAFFTDIRPDLPKVLYGDVKRIRQVVLNLLTNAAKYTEKGFVKLTIDFTATENEDEIELMFGVKDSGIGIRKEDVGKLFAEFQQVDTRRNRKVEGTGLGLAISRQLTELMGGKITVESEYGKGSLFSFSVRQGVHSAEPCVDVPDKEKLVVLAYEPNKYYYKGMQRVFDEMGIALCIEERKEDFLQKLSVGPFTHIIYDYDKVFFDVRDLIKKREQVKFVSMLDTNSYHPQEIDELNHCYMHKPLTIYGVEEILCDEERRNERDKDLQLFVAPDIKILIIDDNPVNLKVAQGLFSSYQCQIDTVTSGFEALELMMEKPVYDMLFIDHMMPEMDGVETLQLIRSRLGEYGKKVTAVALTANVLKESQDMFAASGFQGFLAKPIVLRLLHDVMNRLVPEDKKVMIESDEQRRLIGTSISEEDMERISMKGVDVETGLRCCGNRVEEYIKILKIVVADGRNKVRLLKQYAQDKNYEYYGIEAHAFKSVAASIGAMKQSELAREHEFAVKDGCYEIVDKNYMKLINSYQFLLNQIQRVLDKEDERLHNNNEQEKQEIAEEELEKKILETADYLAAFKQKKANTLLNEIMTYRMPEPLESAVKAARDKLSLYDDEAAEQILRDALK